MSFGGVAKRDTWATVLNQNSPLYAPDPTVLPQILTASSVLDAIGKS